MANQVPLIGTQLTGNVHELRRSSIIGLIVGVLALIWGTTGLAQAGLFTMEQVWNLPGPARPGYVQRLGRALLFLGVLGLGVVVTTPLAAWTPTASNACVIVVLAERAGRWSSTPGMYLIGFRVLTPRRRPAPAAAPRRGRRRDRLDGAADRSAPTWSTTSCTAPRPTACSRPCSACWPGSTSRVEITVYAAEVNVVLARRLWPRAIVQPPLTEADRASMALQALQNQRRSEQQIEVTFDDRPPGVLASPDTPRTPDDVAPPGRPRHRRAAEDKESGAGTPNCGHAEGRGRPGYRGHRGTGTEG